MCPKGGALGQEKTPPKQIFFTLGAQDMDLKPV